MVLRARRLLSLAAFTAAFIVPATARAEGALGERLTSHWAVAALAAALLAVAFVVNRYAPKGRKGVRRTTILFVVYLISVGVAFLLAGVGSMGWSDNIRLVAEVLYLFACINLATLVVELGLRRTGVEVTEILVDLAVGAAYILATLGVLRQSGVNFAGILTTSAVVTGILALSLQATLGNILGGIALQADNSIKPGDWVQLENGKQGRVRQIRWRHTVIETRDWDTLIVPNAALLAATIMILGKRDGETVPHRMWVYFNIDFRYPPADVIEVVENALRAAPISGVAHDPAPNCICLDFAREHRNSFGYYAVRYWLTDLARDDPTSSLVRERIFSALKRANIPLAVPASTLFVEQEDAAKRERKELRETADRMKALRAVELLNPLTDEELQSVAPRLRFAPFARGEQITKQGARAHWLYILVDGTAEIRVEVDGTEKAVKQLKAPSFFGEMGLMTGASRAATVVAVTDCDCFRLEKEAFQQIVAERPEIAREISTILAQRKVELDEAREHLDASTKAKRLDAEKTKLLSTIQGFFGLKNK